MFRTSGTIKCLLILSIMLLVCTAIAYADDCTHIWNEIYREESTCDEHGYIEYRCTLCSETKKESLPLAKHTWSKYETIKKATVFKKGKKESYCEECGASRYKSIKKLKSFARISKKSLTLKTGKSRKLKVKYARGDKVKFWRSSNKRVASVSKKGKIKAKKSGKATITVTLKSGKKAKCKVTVKGVKKRKAKPHKKSSRGSGTVYWTPSGKVYHVSRSCPTLSRSRTVYSGSISQSHKSRCCKVCG